MDTGRGAPVVGQSSRRCATRCSRCRDTGRPDIQPRRSTTSPGGSTRRSAASGHAAAPGAAARLRCAARRPRHLHLRPPAIHQRRGWNPDRRRRGDGTRDAARRTTTAHRRSPRCADGGIYTRRQVGRCEQSRTIAARRPQCCGRRSRASTQRCVEHRPCRNNHRHRTRCSATNRQRPRYRFDRDHHAGRHAGSDARGSCFAGADRAACSRAYRVGDGQGVII